MRCNWNIRIIILIFFAVNFKAKADSPLLISEKNAIQQRFGAWIKGSESETADIVLPALEVIRHDHVSLERNRSVLKTPLKIGNKNFSRGLGTHATSHVRIHLPEDAERFVAKVGIDNNYDTQGKRGSVVFLVIARDKVLFASEVLKGAHEPVEVDVRIAGYRRLDLHVTNGGDNDSWDQCDWADAAIITERNEKMWLDEMPLKVGKWLGDGLPFSFVYDGKKSSEFLTNWKTNRVSKKLDANRTLSTITYLDEKTGLEVSCEVTEFADFPAIEWVVYFKNNGTVDSPFIDDIHALDMTIRSVDTKKPLILHSATGGVCTVGDYEPFETDLSPGKSTLLSSAGGRSSNRNLPFFNIEAGDRGIMVGIGWTGEWSANLAMDTAGNMSLIAGMPKTHLKLHAGEKIRSPRILVLTWEGERIRGHNLLRKFIYKHHTPLLAGKKPLPPTQCNTWFPVGDDGGKANEQNQIELLAAYQPLGIEYIVMDAGWYGETATWWSNVGTWIPRKDTFPNGIKPVGDVAKQVGIKFGMWFEPERVIPGTQLDKEHPDWLIKIDEQGNRLLNLGLPEAQKWFVEMVSSYIKDVPLGYYRQDFNMEPLPYWQKADEPDRIGMTEIKHIEGLYKIWDELMARFPDIMIEGCASGGRRIDLESISRCHTYWKTDLYGIAEANQGHIYGASLYIPGNYLNTPLFDLSDDPYIFRSQLGGALCLAWDPRRGDFDMTTAKARVDEFKQYRHLTIGDFYPLMPYNVKPDGWMAYQFHRDDLNEGMALIFRHGKSPYVAIDIILKGLSAEVDYELTFQDTGKKITAKGSELSEPIRIIIEKAPGSSMITYKKMLK